MKHKLLFTFLLFSFAAHAQIITTVAGGDTLGLGDGGPATACELQHPIDVAVDAAGNFYISDRDDYRIRKVSADGIITTIAGNGTVGFSGDNGPATAAQIDFPYGIAVDGSGNIYFTQNFNMRVRKISATGIITTIAGNGTAGYNGDNIMATAAEINSPSGVAIDAFGNIYIADNDNNRIRKVDTAGIITTYAGTGVPGFSGDNGPATTAEIYAPYGITLDTEGNLYIADMSNARVREVNTSGIITTVAGNGSGLGSGDGGPATAAGIAVTGVAADNWGNIYIADPGHYVIWKIDAAGIATTIAGTLGSYGYNGDNIPAITAKLNDPTGVAVDNSGNIYIADFGNGRIRFINSVVSVNVVANNPVSLAVYPNPTTGKFTLQTTSPKQYTIAIRNVVGDKIYHAVFDGTSAEVDISGEDAGVYFVYVESGDARVVRKISLEP